MRLFIACVIRLCIFTIPISLSLFRRAVVDLLLAEFREEG